MSDIAPIQELAFVSPRTLEEACQALADGRGLPVAGGTDVIPQMKNGRLRGGQRIERLVDLSHLCGLDDIEVREDGENGARTLTIGALTSFRALAESPLVPAEAAALAQAAESVGCLQTRNRGTLGGNLGNASPAGDSLPPLLVDDAQVTLASLDGERTLPLSSLLQGPGKTALAPGEIICRIAFQCLPGAKSIFLKLGSRQGMAVSVVSVAALLKLDEAGKVAIGRIVMGAVAPTARRALKAEALLSDQPLTEALIQAAAEQAAQECAPISDVRGTADYRRHAVKVLVRRALHALAG
jgi:CO/xanthine dehydrogenase FAD-binding subunit